MAIAAPNAIPELEVMAIAAPNARPELEVLAIAAPTVIPELEVLAIAGASACQNFKFSPTAVKIVPPDPGSITTDPDNIMSPEMKRRFLDINERFREVFTTTPGRYNNYYGMVDNSLRFSTPPVQSSRVATPSYNIEMTKQLAAKIAGERPIMAVATAPLGALQLELHGQR